MYDNRIQTLPMSKERAANIEELLIGDLLQKRVCHYIRRVLRRGKTATIQMVVKMELDIAECVVYSQARTA